MQGVETVPVVGTIAVRKWAASSGVPRRCRDYEVLQAEAMRVRAAVMVAFGAAKSNGPAGTRVARAPQIGVLPCRRSADPGLSLAVNRCVGAIFKLTTSEAL